MATILLDLDGTLTDPALGITNCIAYALKRLHSEPPPAEALHFAIGPPLRGSFATLLDTTDATTIEEAMSFYRERFATVGLFENMVYDGVPQMLADLKANHFRLLLATAKPQVYATRILEHFNLRAAFDHVYGSELDGTRQHKTDLLAYLIAEQNLAPAYAVMIGDRHHDIDAARANGCRSLGVTYGYGCADELAQADRVVGGVAEIAPTVAVMFT